MFKSFSTGRNDSIWGNRNDNSRKNPSEFLGPKSACPLRLVRPNANQFLLRLIGKVISQKRPGRTGTGSQYNLFAVFWNKKIFIHWVWVDSLVFLQNFWFSEHVKRLRVEFSWYFWLRAPFNAWLAWNRHTWFHPYRQEIGKCPISPNPSKLITENSIMISLIFVHVRLGWLYMPFLHTCVHC